MFIPFAIEDDILFIYNPFPNYDTLVLDVNNFNDLPESNVKTIDSTEIITNDIRIILDSDYPDIDTVYYAIRAASNMSTLVKEMCLDKIDDLESLLGSNMVIYIGNYVNEFGFNRDTFIGIMSDNEYIIFSVYDNSTEDFQFLFEFETG